MNSEKIEGVTNVMNAKGGHDMEKPILILEYASHEHKTQ